MRVSIVFGEGTSSGVVVCNGGISVVDAEVSIEVSLPPNPEACSYGSLLEFEMMYESYVGTRDTAPGAIDRPVGTPLQRHYYFSGTPARYMSKWKSS